jgi:hypothetical protein
VVVSSPGPAYPRACRTRRRQSRSTQLVRGHSVRAPCRSLIGIRVVNRVPATLGARVGERLPLPQSPSHGSVRRHLVGRDLSQNRVPGRAGRCALAGNRAKRWSCVGLDLDRLRGECPWKSPCSFVSNRPEPRTPARCRVRGRFVGDEAVLPPPRARCLARKSR